MTLGSSGASREGRARLLIGCGLVVIVVAGVAAYRSRPEPTVGGTAVAALESAPAAASAPAAPTGSSAAPREAAPADEVVPARLRVPALKLDVTVAAVGVDAETGELAVPPSVDRVGWYRFGPGVTARAGSIVVAGHVDSADQGRGAFFRLSRLAPGDTMTLAGPDGADRAFEVVARERYRKTRIPLDRYFARDGAPRLTLITCGGPFDAKTRHYRDNIVVTAKPTS
ncbi:sortase [Actinoplanes sp. ATCC 53533]|uniref:class F sortase n=1 Tax=Actinoplanes sp. ATCC 53533 TaxID=1288362 RepID=UPI000F79BB41|nr:class F sortase [Actinoplanes sp. ATCC 53533]RSM65454.1 sortase [Actinoplanes sp. ATCC 53533]